MIDMKALIVSLAAALVGAVPGILPAAPPEARLAVHEWGTFTSLQDEAGDAIGGVNTDDEPAPKFVHRLADGFFVSASEAPPVFFQGAPKCHPDVTLRMETPVLYFHPPAGWKHEPIDVHVAFRGGWLTEFYPAAEARAPGFDAARPDRVFPAKTPEADSLRGGFGHLRADASGELSWNGVQLDSDGAGPETSDKVWLAPRAVASSPLRTADGEREKFLFYRGVGHADAALRIVRDPAHDALEIRAAPGDPDLNQVAWLVEIRADGACAFRRALQTNPSPSATIPASFAPGDFSGDGLARLQGEMQTALVRAGLFADEAQALLRTWEVSYFKSPGLRLFYLCGSDEVNRLLPLRISAPCDVTRVMIGRIEIVTPKQRALLARIAAGPAPELWQMRGVTGDPKSDFFNHPENLKHWNDVLEGRAPYLDLGLPIPEIYGAYLQLGRFRNALLLDEEKRRPTPALGEYIAKNDFGAYQIKDSGH